MGFFDLLWGWADDEPKDWSEAAYKRTYKGPAGELGNFFARFWGWADYEPKDWLKAPYRGDHSARRSSVAYGWFR